MKDRSPQRSEMDISELGVILVIAVIIGVAAWSVYDLLQPETPQTALAAKYGLNESQGMIIDDQHSQEELDIYALSPTVKVISFVGVSAFFPFISQALIAAEVIGKEE